MDYDEKEETGLRENKVAAEEAVEWLSLVDMNKKCAAFVFVGTITCICLNFGQFSPLKTHRINLYTVNAVKVLTLLNDITVAAKMLTSRVWYQSVAEWVKMAIMCNLLVNWDKLLKMTNHYIVTWKSSPICDQSKSDHDLLVPSDGASCAITLL